MTESCKALTPPPSPWKHFYCPLEIAAVFSEHRRSEVRPGTRQAEVNPETLWQQEVGGGGV